MPPSCYLLFDEASGGSFHVQWSREPFLENALAAFVPGTEDAVAEHKLTDKGGRTELCRGVGGPNAKIFYAGWCSFIKRAAAYTACTFVQLGNVENRARHVAIYVRDHAAQVQRLSLGSAVALDAYTAVAVVHVGSRAYESGTAVVRTLTQAAFVSAASVEAGSVVALVDVEQEKELGPGTVGVGEDACWPIFTLWIASVLPPLANARGCGSRRLANW